MFFMEWKMQFWRPLLKWFNKKTKKSYLEVRKKFKKNCKNILLIGHLETNSAQMTTVLQNFWRKSEKFSPKGGIFFKKPTMFSSKCSSGHVKCLFDNSVQMFRPTSESFGSKCIFDDCWNISAGISINFAWKTTINWKTNTFLIETPQKILGTLKIQFQQKWRNFFFKTKIFFCLSPKFKKKTWEPFTKKPKKYFRHVKCTFGNAAEIFSQRSGQLSLKVQKLSKISENTIIVLKVVHWTRRKQFRQLCWKLFAGSSRHFASKSKLNWKKNCFWKKIPQKVLRRLECKFDKTDETFFFRTMVFFARTRS